MKIGNLSENDFTVMIVKMIQDLIERMEAQTKKLQEMFNKELEDLKNRRAEINNTTDGMKNTLEGIDSRPDDTVECIGDLEERIKEVTQKEKINENSLRDL